ncbi:hypothetical protein OSB04_008208 [Centaurea solstitialis]|uniref:Uncharacterized protein n=1 Tax=Centaurea solstitialis TaxID=347529 RepID=A0AA38U5U7_9ASTR|nr:hypothetical protein OSB04_008208 [Centaurea solstitialis]
MSTFTIEEHNLGLAKCLQHIYASLDIVAIQCALELHIPDIINNHDGPVTLAQIAHGINSPSLNVDGLSRLMAFLVQRQIFDQVENQLNDPLYKLNPCSKWLVKDSKTTIAPLVMLHTDLPLRSLLDSLSRSIAEGGTATMKAFGLDLWSFLSINPHSNEIFNEGMACRTRITMDALISKYRFDELKGTLVDVGGGLGAAINEIVTAYPHLKGINFDLPLVISSAPKYEAGVTHVGGDMFKSIPPANSIFLKSIMHNWSDAKCIQLLKNCRNSLPLKTGKIVIVDIILHYGGDNVFEDTRIALDLLKLSSFESGKERTEVEWKKILNEAGFYRYNVIQIPAVESIIEAYSD